MSYNIGPILYISAIKVVKWLDLRHTNISQMLLNDVDLSTAMARSGHSQVSTLLGYCHTNLEKEREAGNLFAKFL
jgi:site-specific recombinase XerD